MLVSHLLKAFALPDRMGLETLQVSVGQDGPCGLTLSVRNTTTSHTLEPASSVSMELTGKAALRNEWKNFWVLPVTLAEIPWCGGN